MRKGLFWLSDGQWARIEPHLPTDLPGPDSKDDRRIISGIVHMLQCGARWRDCPGEYGPYTTIFNRFNRWSKRGRWEAIFAALAMDPEEPVPLALDSSSVKAHRSAAGGKGGRKTKSSDARAAGERQKGGELMTGKLRSATILCVAIFLTGTQSTWCPALGAELGEKLTGEELKTAFAGNTIYIEHRNGVKQIAYYRQDGTGKTTSGSKSKDFTWNVDGDLLCHDTSRRRKCYTITNRGTYYGVMSEDYKWSPKYRIEKGNVMKY